MGLDFLGGLFPMCEADGSTLLAQVVFCMVRQLKERGLTGRSSKGMSLKDRKAQKPRG